MNFTLLGARPLYMFVNFVLGFGSCLKIVVFGPSCYALGGKNKACLVKALCFLPKAPGIMKFSSLIGAGTIPGPV